MGKELVMVSFTLSIVSCIFLLSFLNGGLFERIEQVDSNGANCTLLSETQCGTVGACVWNAGANPAVCEADPCFERKALATLDCKTITGGPTCVHVQNAANENTVFCVTDSRAAGLKDNICSLEWGEYKIPEYGLCKTAGSGCGDLTEVPVQGFTYYLCAPGTTPPDPCSSLTEEICPYVRECMWEAGQCVTDSCWESILLTGNLDKCREGCGLAGDREPKSLTSMRGYCKSPGKNLQSECNAVSSGVSIGVCTIADLHQLPDSLGCKGVATITNFDGSTLYVCNTEDKDFNGAVSLNSFAVALSVLILLMLMI